MSTILVVHPNAATVRRITRACTDWGHAVVPITEVTRALRLALERAPDLVIIGHLLSMDTADFCRELKEVVRTKVVALTDDAAAHPALVSAGASRVTAPRCGRRELKRAVRWALHEAVFDRRMHLSPTIRLGPFTYITLCGVGFVDGRGLCLTRIENALLKAMARRPGEVVLHHELTKAAWPRTACRHVPRRRMQLHIHNLRRKLAEYGPNAPTIELSCLNGYRLIPKGPVVVHRHRIAA